MLTLIDDTPASTEVVFTVGRELMYVRFSLQLIDEYYPGFFQDVNK